MIHARGSKRKRPFARRTAAAIFLISSIHIASTNAAFTSLDDTNPLVEDLDADLDNDNFNDLKYANGGADGKEPEDDPEPLQEPGQDLKGQQGGHWGTPPSTASAATATAENSSTVHSHTFVHKMDMNDNNTINHTHNQHHPHPHPHYDHTITHPPPNAFTLTAKIQHRGGQSFFEINAKEEAVIMKNSIPYIECNSVGSTTLPIPTSSISFRSFPKRGHPTSWTYTHGFIVPLSSIMVEVQTTSMTFAGSEQHKNAMAQDKQLIFHAGEIIWVDGEYRMSSAEDDKDLSALIVDVPKKDGKANDIFGVANDKDVVNMMNCNDLGVNDSSSSSPMGAVKSLAKDVRTSFPVRKTILASLGLSLSSMLTFFWIKVAPLQLAVGIGGVCLVAGGSLGIIMGGELVCDEIQSQWQRAKEERDRLEDDDEYII